MTRALCIKVEQGKPCWSGVTTTRVTSKTPKYTRCHSLILKEKNGITTRSRAAVILPFPRYFSQHLQWTLGKLTQKSSQSRPPCNASNPWRHQEETKKRRRINYCGAIFYPTVCWSIIRLNEKSYFSTIHLPVLLRTLTATNFLFYILKKGMSELAPQREATLDGMGKSCFEKGKKINYMSGHPLILLFLFPCDN